MHLTETELNIMATAIATFNEVAGTRYRVEPHRVLILRRILEHPELTAEDHRGIIIAAFQNPPEWKGHPSPGAVVYGSPKLWEYSIQRWRLGRASLNRVEPPLRCPNCRSPLDYDEGLTQKEWRQHWRGLGPEAPGWSCPVCRQGERR